MSAHAVGWHDCLLLAYRASLLLVFYGQFSCAISLAVETAMTKQTRITYLFDPLCGWCYGASATLENSDPRAGYGY